MALDPELLEILVCPENKTSLHQAENETISRLNSDIDAGAIKNRKGAQVVEKIHGGLIREDGKFLYPIRDDIPILLIDEAIPL